MIFCTYDPFENLNCSTTEFVAYHYNYNNHYYHHYAVVILIDFITTHFGLWHATVVFILIYEREMMS